VANSRTEVQLDFYGTPLQTAGWILASLLATLLLIPLAWVNAAIARWICQSTAFSDGTTPNFRGTGGEVVVWHVLLVLLLALQVMMRSADVTSIAMVFGMSYVVIVGIALMLLKWFVYNVQLNPGLQLTFTGSFIGLLAWYVVLLASICTVIGWAWVVVAMYRWIAQNTKGQGIAIDFRASAVEFLWRGIAFIAGSLLIVTIPFLLVWFMRWMIGQFVLIRGVDTEWGGFIEEQRTPQKPSWPAVPPLHRTID